MRTIALEEHFATEMILNGPGSWHTQSGIAEKLGDLGNARIKAMDDGGIDLSVLSLAAPGVEQLDGPAAVRLARDSNDELAAAVQKYPDRLAGFAALPISEPDPAAEELERAVRTHGFVGAVINGHCRGVYLDDPHFAPILDRAASLQVPIYLHPTVPPPAVIESCYAGFSEEVTYKLATVGWGWHINTGTHVLRVILGGVFDRHPNLQLIIGHMGEAIPFMVPRLDAKMQPEVTGLKRPISAYLRENLHYTFSNFNHPATFASLIAHVGVERVAFSTDYPFASMREGREFLDNLPLSKQDRARISHRNAELLLGV